MNVRGTTERQFISVNIPHSEQDPDSKSRRNVSLYRKWKQLSSLQRSFVIMFLLGVVIISFMFYNGIYPWTTDLSPYGTEKDSSVEKQKMLFKPIEKPDRKAIEEQNLKELEAIKKHMFAKRGPPKLDKRKAIVQDHGVEITDKTTENNDEEEGMKIPENTHGNELHEPLGPTSPQQVVTKHEKEEQDVKIEGQTASNGIHILPLNALNERQKAVVNAFKHAWKAYKAYAWGHDELQPISKTYSEWFRVGLTLIDSLDTMYLMNLQQEFKEARDWVASSLTFNRDVEVNLFEITIRVLGGLLSAYHMSGDRVFLDKAIDLGDRLLPAFDSPSGIPFSDVNIGRGTAHGPRWGPDSSTSEVSTIQLEFKYLSHITGNSRYSQVVERTTAKLHDLPKEDGLVPIFISAGNGQFRPGSTITLGARGDSYYEYLLKQWLQTGKTENSLRDDFSTAMDGVMSRLVRKSQPNQLTYVGELLSGSQFSPKMDHLVCFLPGTLALGAYNGLSENFMGLAKELLETCFQMYARMPTGLSPEIAYFNTNGESDDIIVKPLDAHNLLRPETVESLYILYRLTGDKKYQEYGWKIFEAFEKYTKIEGGGYSSINDVRSPSNPRFRDKMESFFLGETLKYLFLLFSDIDVVPLSQYVFNTEAHPLPIWMPER